MESVSDTTAKESFNVTDWEKSIPFVNILAEIKDKKLSLLVFMLLLKNLLRGICYLTQELGPFFWKFMPWLSPNLRTYKKNTSLGL